MENHFLAPDQNYDIANLGRCMASDEKLRGSEPLNHLSNAKRYDPAGHGSAQNVTRSHKARAGWMVPSAPPHLDFEVSCPSNRPLKEGAPTLRNGAAGAFYSLGPLELAFRVRAALTGFCLGSCPLRYPVNTWSEGSNAAGSSSKLLKRLALPRGIEPLFQP